MCPLERRGGAAGEGGRARGRRARGGCSAVRKRPRVEGKCRKLGSDRLIPCKDTPHTQYGGWGVGDLHIYSQYGWVYKEYNQVYIAGANYS